MNRLKRCFFKTVDQHISEATFISVTTDESVDVAVFKKLMILITVIVEGSVKIYFGKNVDVIDGKADTITSAILNYPQEKRIPPLKVAGLGGDGAAVMTGRLNGVGVQLSRECSLLLHVHYCSHRLALAVSQSAHAVDAVKHYEETVNHIFNYFNNSPVRYNKLRELQQVLIDATVALKEPHSVRWLSLHEAILALSKCWPALVACLGADAAADNPVARGLSSKVETYSFVAYTCILDGVLPLFTKLSKTYQHHSLDFDKMESMLHLTRQTLEAFLTDNTLLTSYNDLQQKPTNQENKITWMGIPIKKTGQAEHNTETAKNLLINELLANLERQFPKNGMAVLRKLNNMLNPKKMAAVPQAEVGQYGQQDLQDISGRLSQPGGVDPQMFSPIRAKNDFFMFKLHCRGSQKSLPEFAKELMTDYKDEFSWNTSRWFRSILRHVNVASVARISLKQSYEIGLGKGD